ncbi:S-methyl-5-thioribose-1-phosphate isomerase [Candidatus Omnitrophota bacterium]
MRVKTLEYKKNKLKIIDQRLLPANYICVECNNIKDAYKQIKTLAVRGAPAIGVFAAYGLCVGLKEIKNSTSKRSFFKRFNEMVDYLKGSRPTAVNLFWALDRMKHIAYKYEEKSVKEIKDILLCEAKRLHKEDELMCDLIGKNGSRLIKSGDSILTHCNAGALATAGDGTALSVIYRASEAGKKIRVYADETRPLLQGARLTAWELKQRDIDVTLICDNMAATVMRQKKVNKIIVGADRIAGNGDVANKIGTYGLAVLAKEHNIPFYVAAPSSTFDLKLKSGSDIPIENRDADEVRRLRGVWIAPKNIEVFNPAFDVTPSRYISAIITEKGVFRKPYGKALKKMAQ